MCQTILIFYSCGCLKEQLSITCKDPQSICTHLSQFFDQETLPNACEQHKSHPAFRVKPYTSTQDWTIRPSNLAETPVRAIRRRPVFEQLRSQQMPVRAGRPERVRAPSKKGLDGLQEKFGLIAVSDAGSSHSKSGMSPSGSIPNRFENPRPNIVIPRPAAPDIMGVPVYDNGTDASYKAAQKLKSLSRSNTIDSGYRSQTHTQSSYSPRSNDHKASTSVSTTQRRDSSADQSLYPAPLNIQKKINAQDLRGRPLPTTPSQLLQPSSTSIGKPGSRTSTNERSRSKAREAAARHDDSVRKQQQVSQTRIANAQRAIGNGKWTENSTCPEIEALNGEERRRINEYIRSKRDAERRRSRKHQKLMDGRNSQAKNSDGHQRRCTVM